MFLFYPQTIEFSVFDCTLTSSAAPRWLLWHWSLATPQGAMIGQWSKSSKEPQRGKKTPLCTAREDPKFHLPQLYFPKVRFKTVRTVQFQTHTQYESACRCCSSALQADKWWAVFRAVCFFSGWQQRSETHQQSFHHILHPIDYFTTLQCFMSIGVCRRSV